MRGASGSRSPALRSMFGLVTRISTIALVFSLLPPAGVVDLVGDRSALAATPHEPRFTLDSIFSGLTEPTAARFAPDGRVFIAEKSGVIKVFDGLGDSIPDVVVDLSANVHDFWDRGLLGLAVDPHFPSKPYIYALYAYDPGDSWNDGCLSPPGATNDGCVVDGRLSRLQVNSSNQLVGDEEVLLDGLTDVEAGGVGLWCSQYPSHSIGDLAFGPDRMLYVTGGEGASFTFTDWGQGGGDAGSPTPENPCGDPPVPVGGDQNPPGAEGGALRSQDLLTSGDPISYDGAVLRVDPDTGDPVAGSDPEDRIIAFGLRNPFRMTFRPRTDEIWVGDVGWGTWEEINVVADANDGTIENFGWPCYEGPNPQSSYNSADLDLCEGLYSGQGQTAPYYEYQHGSGNAPDANGCPNSGATVTGLAFYRGGDYPAQYLDALFFGDHTHRCVWVMFPDGGGNPDPGNIVTIVSDVGVVDLQVGPGGDVFIVDFDGGEVLRLEFNNTAPVADAQALPTSGPAPLKVSFDGSGSSDPDGDPLSYDWDLDGDGQFDDSTEVAPIYTYTVPGTYTIGLRVTDPSSQSDTDIDQIQVDNNPPTATITTPGGSFSWRVGDTVDFTGTGTDPDDGDLPASAFLWEIILHHCDTPTDCHAHGVLTITGVKSGNFTAPDHEYPSFLEVQLEVTDSGGLKGSDSVQIQPETVILSFETDPAGLDLVVGDTQDTSPFSRKVIIFSGNTVSAPTPQTSNGFQYTFQSWSDGGDQTHIVTAPATPATYTATFFNASPVSTDDAYGATEDTTLSVAAPGVLGNDADPEGDALETVLVATTSNGSLLLNDDGSFVYTPAPDFSGSDSFGYRATDTLSESNTATVQITVEAEEVVLPEELVKDQVGLVDPSRGRWYLRDVSGGTTSFWFGDPDDVPFLGDWDCDGVDTPGLYRRSDGFVYLRNSNTQGVADVRFFFGNPGDTPLPGDFDADGCDTVSLYRPTEARVYVINTLASQGEGLGAADFSFGFGDPGDQPFVGDFDDDGIDEVGLHRISTGLVYFRFTLTTGLADAHFIYGNPGDLILAGRWTGQGPDTVGIFRSQDARFYLRYSNTPGVAAETIPYGSGGMLPVTGRFGIPEGTDPPPSS